ncbi:HAD-like domain containing protein [Cryptosporidium felis]|nr:HAD-like domain containing protein [Cryptosporidium felis]
MTRREQEIRLRIEVVGSNYDGTITKYDTLSSVVLRSCKKHYSGKLGTKEMANLERETEKIQNMHASDRLSWCNEWLPSAPLDRFDGNSIGKLFLAISEFEYIYNFKIEKEMRMLQLLNQNIVDNSSLECREGWEFRDGALETLKRLCRSSRRFLIVSVSKGSKRIRDTLQEIVPAGSACQFDLITSEFEYKSETFGSVGTAPNSLYGPSCKYKAFRQSVKEAKKISDGRVRGRLRRLLASMGLGLISSRDLYVKSVYFGSKANDLECLLYSEIGVFIADLPDAESLCDAKTSDFAPYGKREGPSRPETFENALNMDPFAFKICQLFSVCLVPISISHSERVRRSGLKLYQDVARNEQGVVEIRDYLRISRKLRFQNARISQFRFSGILLIAFDWDEVAKLFFSSC